MIHDTKWVQCCVVCETQAWQTGRIGRNHIFFYFFPFTAPYTAGGTRKNGKDGSRRIDKISPETALLQWCSVIENRSEGGRFFQNVSFYAVIIMAVSLA